MFARLTEGSRGCFPRPTLGAQAVAVSHPTRGGLGTQETPPPPPLLCYLPPAEGHMPAHVRSGRFLLFPR